MTVGELRAKLLIFQDDVEIFTFQYDDILCQDSFNEPYLIQEDVRVNTNKRNGYQYYTKWNAQIGAKQHTVLVIS
jgi:hypothetical protein